MVLVKGWSITVLIVESLMTLIMTGAKMPKCNACGNTTKFTIAYIEFEVAIFQGDKCVDNFSGDRERLDETYPPECYDCGSIKIEGEV
jgi:hypothetical protein